MRSEMSGMESEREIRGRAIVKFLFILKIVAPRTPRTPKNNNGIKNKVHRYARRMPIKKEKDVPPLLSSKLRHQPGPPTDQLTIPTPLPPQTT